MQKLEHFTLSYPSHLNPCCFILTTSNICLHLLPCQQISSCPFHNEASRTTQTSLIAWVILHPFKNNAPSLPAWSASIKLFNGGAPRPPTNPSTMGPTRLRTFKESRPNDSHGWSMQSSSCSAYPCYGPGELSSKAPNQTRRIAKRFQKEYVPRRLSLLPAPLPNVHVPPHRLPLSPHLRLLHHKPHLHAPPHPPPIPRQLPQPHNPLPNLQHRSIHPPRPLNRHVPLRLPRPLLRLSHGHRLHSKLSNRVVSKRRLRIRFQLRHRSIYPSYHDRPSRSRSPPLHSKILLLALRLF